MRMAPSERLRLEARPDAVYGSAFRRARQWRRGRRLRVAVELIGAELSAPSAGARTIATTCGGECGLSLSNLHDHCDRPASAARRKRSPHVGDGLGERSARITNAWRTSLLSRMSWRLD